MANNELFTISLKSGNPNMSFSQLYNSIIYKVFYNENKNESISLDSFTIVNNNDLSYQVQNLEFTISDLFFDEIGLYNTANIDTNTNSVTLTYHNIQTNDNLRYMDISFNILYTEEDENLQDAIMKRVYIEYEEPPSLFSPGRPIYQKRKYCCPRVNPLPDNYETATVKHRQTDTQRASQLIRIYGK